MQNSLLKSNQQKKANNINIKYENEKVTLIINFHAGYWFSMG